MNLKSKIYIDKLIGNPTVFIFDILSKSVQLFKKQKEPDNSKIKRITICKFLGMGSIIQSTPLLMTLRINYPNAEINFITHRKNYELLETFPFIGRIVILDDRSFISLLTNLVVLLINQWIKRTDLFIDLEVHSNFSKILTFLSFPKIKFGLYKKESAIQLGIYTKMIYFNTKVPVFKIYLQIAHILKCVHIYNELFNWKGHSRTKDGLTFPSFYEFNNINKEYIVLNPNASDLRVERRWDRNNFVELVNQILCEYPDKIIVLTGSSDEKDYVEKIYSQVNKEYSDRVLDSCGKLSFNDLVTLINNCMLMITNDSGPMHIALALKKRTIALFGPCTPYEYYTYKNVQFIYKNIYCSPCVHYFTISPCNGDNQCMKLITTDEVMNAVRNTLNNNLNKSVNIFGDGVIYDSLIKGVLFGIAERKSSNGTV